MPESQTIKHYNYVDALRGLAILLVLAIHVGQNVAGITPLSYFIFTKGQYGVQLFFIVSAFTLFLSYSQRIIKDGKNAVKFFFIRRFFRIAPAYYCAIIFYSLLIVFARGLVLKNLDFSSILASVLFVNSFIPKAINYIPPGGWTIGTEMLFYLFIPLLFTRVKSLSGSIFLFFSVVVLSLGLNESVKIVALHLWHLKVVGDWFLYYWLPNQFPVFVLGFVCYFVLQKKFTISKLTAYINLALALIWAAITFFICKKFDFLPEHILISFSFCLILITLAKQRISFLENFLTRFFGKISFSMYLIHFFIIGLYLRYFPQKYFSPPLNVVLMYAIVLTISSFLAYFSFLYIEEKGRNLGRQLIIKLS
jgi:peptidoglycan/LPS O-acetylase OafA/YrhL